MRRSDEAMEHRVPVWWSGVVGNPLFAVALSVGLIGYGALFFRVPIHRAVASLMLLPDELWSQWIGGNTDRIECLDRLPIFAVVGSIVMSALGWGDLGLRAIGFRSVLSPALPVDGDHDRPPRVVLGSIEWSVLAVGLGLVAQSNATLIIGLAGGLHWRVLFVALTAGGIAWLAWLTAARVRAWRSCRGIRRETREDTAGDVARGLDRSSLCLICFMAMVVVMWCLYLLGAAVLPPFEFDVREYHLQVPKEWFLAGRIDFLPHNVYGNMPMGAEMGALYGMSLWGGAEAWWYGALCGKTLLAVYAILAVVLTWQFGRRFWGPLAGPAAALLFLGTPWVVRVSTTGFVEGTLAWSVLVTAYCLARATWDEQVGAWRGWIYLAAITSGFAVGCKYPAILFALLPAAAWCGVWQSMRWSTRHRSVVPWLVAFVLSAAAGGTWYAKNAVLARNPVYPLAGRWLDGKTRASGRIAQWDRAHEVPRDGDGRRYSLSQGLDSAATMLYRSHWVGPILVPFLALSCCLILADRRLLVLWAWLATAGASWFLLTHRIERFLVPVLPLAALVGGVAVDRLWRYGDVATRVVLAVAVSLSVLYSTSASTSRVTGDNRIFVSLGVLRDDEPVESDPGMSRTRPVHRFLNRHMSWRPGEAVLLIGDAEPFDLEMPVYYNTCFDATWLERWFANTSTPKERYAVLKDHGVRIIVVDWSEIERYRKTYGYSEFITRRLVDRELVEQGVWRRMPVDIGPGVELFELSGETP